MTSNAISSYILGYDETLTQLTAAGQTAKVSCPGALYHTFQTKVAAINTNVIVEAQGSLDGTNWFPLTLTNTAVTSLAITTNRATITANGTYALQAVAAVKYVRFDFVSEAGGTAATIDVVYHGRS